MLDAHVDAIKDLIDNYVEGSNVDIETKPLSYDELYGQLNIALTQQATTFDVVGLEDPWIPQFASFLSPLESSSDLSDALVPVCEKVSRYPSEAVPCALPWLGEAQFFGTRSVWLEQAELSQPETWDETVATASDLSASIESDSDLYPFALSTLTWRDLVLSYLPILQGYGKSLIDEETSVPQLDTPEALAAMETFEALARLSPIESSAAGQPSNAERFESGQVAMMSNVWSSNVLASLLMEQKASSGPVEMTPQPAQSGNSRQTMTGIWLLGIPLGSAFPDEAWAFIQWLGGVETQRQLPGRALPPARTDVYSEPEPTGNTPDLASLLNLLDSALPRPRSPFYPQLEQLLGVELGSVMAGEKTGAQALKDANVAIREFLVREGVLEA